MALKILAFQTTSQWLTIFFASSDGTLAKFLVLVWPCFCYHYQHYRMVRRFKFWIIYCYLFIIISLFIWKFVTKSDAVCTNMKTLKEDYLREYKFISDLLSRAHLPTSDTEQSGNIILLIMLMNAEMQRKRRLSSLIINHVEIHVCVSSLYSVLSLYRFWSDYHRWICG